jgi:DNA-binding NarL/FixJ family response regulator
MIKHQIYIITESPKDYKVWGQALSRDFNITYSHDWNSYQFVDHKDIAASLFVIDSSLLDSYHQLCPSIKQSVRIKIIAGDNWPEKKQIETVAEGFLGYCEKATNSDLIRKAVSSVLSGEIWLRRDLMSGVIARLHTKKRLHQKPQNIKKSNQDVEESLKILSERELEVAEMVVDGLDNKTISSQLEITERTVKAHVSSILRKLNVRDRIHLLILLNNYFQFSTQH